MIVLASLCALIGLLIFSLPFWLPLRLLQLRAAVFTRINGDEGIAVPGPEVGADRFLELYAHPAACGRSRGAALSDLFWYWLSPGAELHQEHLEPGERYEAVAESTRRFLAVRKAQAEALASGCMTRVLDELAPGAMTVVRLRDLMMPVWAEVYYEIVFGQACPRAARALIVANARDVVTALKGSGLRHMAHRDRLTDYLEGRIMAGAPVRPLPAHLSPREQALYLQGVFFNTAIVQMSEAMTHLALALAHNPAVQARLAASPDDDRLFDRVIAETLRQFPLFGVAHRIIAEDIQLDETLTLPKGSVLCFNYPRYQRSGFADPDRFDPDRWETLDPRQATYIPFGVTANRPCPAHAIALVTLRAAGRPLVQRFACHSSASHTRAIAHRGPCLLARRDRPDQPRRRAARLALMRVRDRWEDVWSSLAQLLLGAVMVLDARRLRLAGRHFEALDAAQTPGET